VAFHDYMIEWLPNVMNWYVDGVLKHSVLATAGTPLPIYAQHIFTNVWAATGVNTWSGVFTFTAPLNAQIDLVRYTPAPSLSAVIATAGGGCVIQPSTVFDPIMLLMLLFSIVYLIRKNIGRAR